MIYREYFTLDKGYAFQPGSGKQLGSGKLGTSDGESLDLALMYTCRFIASETKDMPLTFNTIFFSTVYRPEWRKWAGRFDYLLNFQEEQRFDLLIHLGQFVTPEMYSEIRAHFPWFVPMLRETERQSKAYRIPERLGYGYSWDFNDILQAPNLPFSGTPHLDPLSALRLISPCDYSPKIPTQGSLEKSGLLQEYGAALLG
jgi:hypothetical protein